MDKALELWVRLLDYIGDHPWELGADGWREYCFFCNREEPDHEANCVYIAAKELVATSERERLVTNG